MPETNWQRVDRYSGAMLCRHHEHLNADSEPWVPHISLCEGRCFFKHQQWDYVSGPSSVVDLTDSLFSIRQLLIDS